VVDASAIFLLLAKRPAMQTAPRGETPDTRRGLAALSAGVAALLILAAAGA
jgi:hypothetical protein